MLIITKTPYRVSLLGGGTDFPSFFNRHGGACLSLAINHYLYVITKPRLDGKIRASYTKTEIVHHPGELQHGIIREALLQAKVYGDIEVVTMGDVPAGTGLGSSSAVTVGMVLALQPDLQAHDLFLSATEIELGRLSKPMGIQDQLASVYGGVNLFEFGKEVERKPLPADITNNLILFAIGKRRRTASSILEQQMSNIPERTAILQELAGLAQIGAGYLMANNVREIGPLLAQAWQLKKRLAYGITNTSIEHVYDLGMRAGATGGKVCGAGGGGYMLFFVEDADRANSVRQAMKDYDELQFEVSGHGAKVIYL